MLSTEFPVFTLKISNLALLLISVYFSLVRLLKFIPNQSSGNTIFITLSFIVRALESLGCGITKATILVYCASEFPEDLRHLFVSKTKHTLLYFHLIPVSLSLCLSHCNNEMVIIESDDDDGMMIVILMVVTVMK